MSRTKSSIEKKRDSSEANGYAHTDKKDDSKQTTLPKKTFIHRNSVLTDLMEVNHLQSVYNISVAVCSLLFLSSVLFYLAAPDKLWQDLNILKYGTGKIFDFTLMWISLQIFAFTIFEGFKLWISFRSKTSPKVADAIFLLLYVASIIFMFMATPYFILTRKLPPITGFSAAAEQVRVFMKIYSFVRENVPRVKQYKPQKDGDQLKVLCPSRKHFLFYLFIPAFIYKDSYPRSNTEKIRWDNVFNNLFKFIGVIFIAHCIFMRFNIDMFKDVGLQPFTRKEAALVFAGSIAVGSSMMFLIFYGILHCWLNIFAELLRFGDKQFYEDWWNSTSFSQYYRRWNKVVYDWLHAYIYVESQQFGCRRSVSLILVFFASALVHEYIICQALGFFYPVLLFVYTTIGVFILFLTKERTTQFWNTFMWFMLFLGWGIIVTCYSAEWFARVNCLKQESTSDFFIPKSWDLSCPILKFF